jgi:signal transduction histidine kinase
MKKVKSLEHKILIQVTLYISIMSMVATLANLPLGMYKTAIVTVLGSICYFMFYRILKSPKAHFLKNGYVVISLFIYNTLLWFFNNGSYGSTKILFLLALTVSLFIVKINKHLYLTIGSILLVLLLVLLESYFPNSVLHTYNSKTDRYIDIAFTIILVFILLKQLIAIIKTCYNNEHKLVEIKNSELINSKKELQVLADITENQNKRLLNFTYIVSHNIRSHSSNLTGLVKLIEIADNEEEKDNLFKMLQTSTEKLEETIQNLNEIIAVQNNINSAKAILNLRNELERTFLVVHELILESNVTINNAVDENIELEVISAYLDSILLNLITNAIKYKSPERALVINISAKLDGKYMVLSVQDNGLGLDLVKHKDKLFGMYKTFHSNANSRGMGLFITKNQIETMGGKIDLESEVNVGTIFKIYFKI